MSSEFISPARLAVRMLAFTKYTHDIHYNTQFHCARRIPARHTTITTTLVDSDIPVRRTDYALVTGLTTDSYWFVDIARSGCISARLDDVSDIMLRSILARSARSKRPGRKNSRKTIIGSVRAKKPIAHVVTRCLLVVFMPTIGRSLP